MTKLAVTALAGYGAWALFGVFGLPDMHFSMAGGAVLTARLAVTVTACVLAYKGAKD